MRKPFKWAGALIGIVCVVMVISAFNKGWEKMLRLGCNCNLRQIGIYCREYAATNQGRMPSSWSDLSLDEKGTNWGKLFCCPSVRPHHGPGRWSQADLWSDYRLFAGRTTNDSQDRILAIESPGNHHGVGVNVLFVDGSTEWFPISRVLGQTNLFR